ncbi:hypothetical protein MTR_5g040310 [Medicago truncatula]|uniref:Uncharacterized protein n=1 Tax=Medicago truncatula TaxID=3880 RepID=G7KDX3_MEDTR|nr:hypothetical protein MTR_5g040310 [Medicago truncatula]
MPAEFVQLKMGMNLKFILQRTTPKSGKGSLVDNQRISNDSLDVEISLEVQGGLDYFRVVEGTRITVIVLKFAVAVCEWPLEIDEYDPEFGNWKDEKKEDEIEEKEDKEEYMDHYSGGRNDDEDFHDS